MESTRQVVAIAGVGDLGKYICEEILANDRFDVVVISRKAKTAHSCSSGSDKNKWLDDHDVDVRISDYSEESVLSILNSANATALISCIACPDDRYTTIHCVLLAACMRSNGCKRFIPSEWAGNIEDYPSLPRFYGKSREPFRRILYESKEIEWTLFSVGWLMDYFLPESKTHITPLREEFPLNLKEWQACIRGTGDEPQAWTCARNIGEAVVELLSAPEWEPVTYIVGEWSTFNKAITLMETFHTADRPFQISHKSAEDIQRVLSEDENDENAREVYIASLDEWSIAGGSACPREKTLRQRGQYFQNVKFLNLEELLKLADKTEFI